MVPNIEPQRKPFGQVELHAEPRRASQTEIARLDRRAPAEREIKVEAPDRSAEPAHFAVSERPHQVTEEKLDRIFLDLDEVDQSLAAVVHRFEQLETLLGPQVLRLEPEIFREMKGVSPAVNRGAVGQVTGVPPAERRQLMAERFLKQPGNGAAIGSLTDQLFAQRLVHALRGRRTGRAQPNEPSDEGS